MLDRIAQAEQRADEAEQRARETVDRIVDLGSELARTHPPVTRQPEPPAAEPGPEPPAAEPGTGAACGERRPPPPPPQASVPAPSAPAPAPAPSSEEKLNVNQATYDDLRRLRLSVTQTGRVLDYRETLGGFKSLDQLDEIAGFPRDLLTELKRKLTI